MRIIKFLAVFVFLILVSCGGDPGGDSGGSSSNNPSPAPDPAPTENHSPTITSLVANPSIIEVGQTSEVSCVAADPDADPLTYEWAANAGVIEGAGSSVTWTAPNTAGNYAIACKVSDGRGDQASAEIAVEVKQTPPPANNPPVIISASVNPSVVEVGQTAEASCVANDPDADPLTYEWAASGGTISGSGSTVSWTAPNIAGSYAITCKTKDGRGGEASAEIAVEVKETPPPANNSPVINSLTATRLSNHGKSWKFICSAVDSDGDAVAYGWLITGGKIKKDNGAGKIVWQQPNKPGSYTVTCNASDGKGGNDSESVEIVVSRHHRDDDDD